LKIKKDVIAVLSVRKEVISILLYALVSSLAGASIFLYGAPFWASVALAHILFWMIFSAFLRSKIIGSRSGIDV
jgi:hypothetical protein